MRVLIGCNTSGADIDKTAEIYVTRLNLMTFDNSSDNKELLLEVIKFYITYYRINILSPIYFHDFLHTYVSLPNNKHMMNSFHSYRYGMNFCCWVKKNCNGSLGNVLSKILKNLIKTKTLPSELQDSLKEFNEFYSYLNHIQRTVALCYKNIAETTTLIEHDSRVKCSECSSKSVRHSSCNTTCSPNCSSVCNERCGSHAGLARQSNIVQKIFFEQN
jgi:hypothetical protein